MSAQATAAKDTAAVLGQAVSARSSGIATAVRGKLKRLFCLERGEIIFVASNLIEEQFEETLVRRKLLSPAVRAKAKLEGSRENLKAARYLWENEIVPRADLEEAMLQHVRELLAVTLDDGDVSCTFTAGRPNLEGELTTRMSCIPSILAHVAHEPKKIDEVRIRIGPPNLRPVRTARTEALLEGLELDASMQFVVDHSDGSLAVSDIVERAGGSPEPTLRAIYGLLLVGILERAEEPEVETAQTGDRVTGDEVLAQLQRSEGVDHYGVLGLNRDCSADEIRDAYYYLARRYHPDRFRTGDLTNMLLRIESFFTKVTEAYNTLVDPESRSQYDKEITTHAAKREREVVQEPGYLARQNFARAKVLIAKRQLPASVQFLENAVELDPSRAEYHRELGIVLSNNPRRRKDAEAALLRSIELDPTAVDGMLALGDLYVKMKRPDDAATKYREVLHWDANNVEAQMGLKSLGRK